MARTHRKVRWLGKKSKEMYIKDALCRDLLHPYRFQKKRRPKGEYERLYEESCREYEAAIEANGGSPFYEYHSIWGGTVMGTIRPRYVSRFTYERVPLTREEMVQEWSDHYDKMHRDGSLNETSRKTGFKNEAKGHVRRRNKKFCKNVLADNDWDDDPYPNRKEGKQFEWNWW